MTNCFDHYRSCLDLPNCFVECAFCCSNSFAQLLNSGACRDQFWQMTNVEIGVQTVMSSDQMRVQKGVVLLSCPTLTQTPDLPRRYHRLFWPCTGLAIEPPWLIHKFWFRSSQILAPPRNIGLKILQDPGYWFLEIQVSDLSRILTHALTRYNSGQRKGSVVKFALWFVTWDGTTVG